MRNAQKKLITQPNCDNTDDLYQRLIEAHADLTDDESLRFNAKLILLLFNHIGDTDVIKEALATAHIK